MKVKDFKGFKNYQKKAPPPTSIQILGKEKRVFKFQKERLWPLLIKGIPTIGSMVAGYLLADLPGALIGAIFGYQIGKFLLKLLKKPLKRFLS